MIALCLSSFSVLSAQAENNVLALPEFSSGKPVWIIKAGASFNSVVGSATKTTKTRWENNEYDGVFKYNTSYDVSFGFNKSFGKSPMYWGMDIKLGTRGYGTDAKYYKNETKKYGIRFETAINETFSLTTYNVYLSPFTFGYRYTFLERMAADIHLGIYASYDFAGKGKAYTSKHKKDWQDGLLYLNRTEENESKYDIKDDDNMHKYDAGINLGVGYWFGHFNIDFSWQRGFIPMFVDGDKMVSVGNGKNDKMQAGNYYTNSFQLKLGFAF